MGVNLESVEKDRLKEKNNYNNDNNNTTGNGDKSRSQASIIKDKK